MLIGRDVTASWRRFGAIIVEGGGGGGSGQGGIRRESVMAASDSVFGTTQAPYRHCPYRRTCRRLALSIRGGRMPYIVLASHDWEDGVMAWWRGVTVALGSVAWQQRGPKQHMVTD
ncbi:hypothetical protein E2C01_099981 [Portunus trituberculatus]|uniref:Uncharacterized protein n=1 Tax=Portunus trituberculatus TaxID=210409 RepID=A0A5B7K588_PORTR|nr:hypothetical protein [Portunus trituberculatus]